MFGDSLMRGVMPDEAWNYHSSDAIGFDAMQAQYNMKFVNYAMPTFTSERVKMWLTQIMSSHPVPDVAFLECGGNDCDYDWKAISADPDGEHLPHTPSERFIDGYCTAIRKARQAGARVAMTSLPPLEQSRYFSFITKGLSAENILRWLGDTDHLYRWQEYYNDMVTQLSRAFGCRLVDLRAEFLKSRVFPSLIGADGIHPTQAGHDLIHQSVQTALSY